MGTMQSEVNVSELIQAARDGDPGALDRVLKLYRNYLRHLARSGVGKAYGAKADPSDVVQDTLIRAFQGFAKFRGETEAELLALCRAQVGPFKAPDRVHILPDLPKGPSGKVQRLKLAEMMA